MGDGMKPGRILLVVGTMFVWTSDLAIAQNTPCSGSKGGISHCRGWRFVCQDESTSASKQDCQTYRAGIYAKDKKGERDKGEK
jgi:hypothetical protein